MCSVYEGTGAGSTQSRGGAAAMSYMRSYSVTTLSSPGANLGGPTTTHAPTASKVSCVSLSLTVAVTGPSATSSYQSALYSPQGGVPAGLADLPKPPSTM